MDKDLLNVPEKEVMPGVFMVDYRFSPKNLGLGLEETHQRIKELETSVKHLVYSNEEMGKAYEEDNDPIYLESQQENIVVIEKQKNQIKALQEYLQSQFPHTVPKEQEQEPDEGGVFV